MATFNGLAGTPPPVRLLGADGRPLPSAGTHAPHVVLFSGIVNAANKAYPSRWDEAYRTSREDALSMVRDGYYITLLKEVWRAVEKMDWHIEPEDGRDAEQQQAAEEITKIVRAIHQRRRLVRSLNWADWYGRSAANATWGWAEVAGKKVYTILGHQHVNGDKIQFGWDNVPRIMIYPPAAYDLQKQGATIGRTDKSVALVLDKPEWRRSFLIHKFDCIDADWFEFHESGSIHGMGLRHWVYWINYLRKNILSWKLDFMERAGQGLTLVFYEEGNPASEAQAQKVVKEYGRNTVIPFPVKPGADRNTGQGIERVEVSVAGAEVLLQSLEYLEKQVERLFVGQSMSSGRDGQDGLGGSGRAKFAQDTKADLICERAALLDDTLTEELVEPLHRYNRPGDKFKLRYVTSADDPESKDKVAAAQVCISLGIPLKADEVRAAAGFSKPEPMDEVVGAGQPGGMTPGQPGQPGQEPGPPPGQDHEDGWEPVHGPDGRLTHHQNAITGEARPRSLVAAEAADQPELYANDLEPAPPSPSGGSSAGGSHAGGGLSLPSVKPPTLGKGVSPSLGAPFHAVPPKPTLALPAIAPHPLPEPAWLPHVTDSGREGFKHSVTGEQVFRPPLVDAHTHLANVRAKAAQKPTQPVTKPTQQPPGAQPASAGPSAHMAPATSQTPIASPVHTPQFKQWFGDWQADKANASEVVDDDGKPLVVYHGTDQHLTQFQKTTEHRAGDPMSVIGYWFVADPKTARRYGDNIVGAYLNLRSPLRLSVSDIMEWDDEHGGIKYTFAPEELKEWLEDTKSDGIIFKPATQDEDEALGLDGEWDYPQYVVLDPSQIKSVDNRGTFDPTNPDIMATRAQPSASGQLSATSQTPIASPVHTPQFKAWFGDWQADKTGASKVVNRQTGEPIPVHHGTATGGFTQFDEAKQDPDALYGPGFYFTEDEGVANSYQARGSARGELKVALEDAASALERRARDRFEQTKKERPGSPMVRGLMQFLDSTRESKLRVLQEQTDWLDQQGIQTDDLVNAPKTSTYHTYLNIRQPFDADTSGLAPADIPDTKRDARADLWQALGAIGHNDWNRRVPFSVLQRAYANRGGKEKIRDILQAAGYDGITHMGGDLQGGGHRHRVWIAFKPEQIKSVDNRGTFDPTNPDIMATRAQPSASGQLPATTAASAPRTEQQQADLHGHRAHLEEKLQEWLDFSGGISWGQTTPQGVALKDHYRAAWQSVWSNMNGKSLARFVHGVKQVSFLPTIAQVTKQWVQEGGDSVPGFAVGGFFNPRTGTITADGGDDTGDSYADTTAEIYAHEAGHGIDHGYEYSDSFEWNMAWDVEIRVPGNPLTAYAASTPREGFAEFARLVWTRPEVARKKFPRCWKQWQLWGLAE